MRTPLGSVPLPLLAPSASAAVIDERPARGLELAERINALSEPDGSFFSDNIISNETSYLQAASALAKLASPGGVYIGVGPEQNFTYIALTRPKVAFIVDHPPAEHDLAPALQGGLRGGDVALALPRAAARPPLRRRLAPAADASIDAVIAHAEKSAPDEAGFGGRTRAPRPRRAGLPARRRR